MSFNFPFPIAQFIIQNQNQFLLTSDGKLFISANQLANDENIAIIECHEYLADICTFQDFSISVRERNLHQKDVVMENTSIVEFRMKNIDLLDRQEVKKVLEDENEKVVLINDANQVIGKDFGKVSYEGNRNIEKIVMKPSNFEAIMLENLISSVPMYPALDFLWNNERVTCFSVSTNGNICLVTESNSIYVFGTVNHYIGKKCLYEYESSRLNFVRLRPPKLACTKSQYCENEFSTSNDFQIIQVECAHSHIIVQCKNWDIYVVGDNSAMLIGLEHRSLYKMLTPLRISALNDLEHVEQIVYLHSCTLFRTSQGRVLFTGSFKSKSLNGFEVFKLPLEGRVLKITGEFNHVAFLMDDHQTVLVYNVALKFGEMIFQTNLEKGEIADIHCSDSCLYILTVEGNIENICFSLQRAKVWQQYGLSPTKKPPVSVKELYNIAPFYFDSIESDLYPIQFCTRIVEMFIYNQTPSTITTIESRNVKYFKEQLYSSVNSSTQTFSDLSLTTK